MQIADVPGAVVSPAGSLEGYRVHPGRGPVKTIEERRVRNAVYDLHNVPHPFTGLHFSDKGLDLLEQYIAEVREVIGMEIPLAIDHVGHISLQNGIRLARRIEKYVPAWLEDVIPWQYTEQYRQLQDATTVPICTGEDIYLKEGFEPLLKSGGLSVIHPDLLTSGGILETKKIGDMAQDHGVAMAIHMAESPDRRNGRGTCRDRDRKLHGARIPLCRCRLVGRYRHRRSQAAREGRLHHRSGQAGPGDRRRRRRGDLAASAAGCHGHLAAHGPLGRRVFLGSHLELRRKEPKMKITDLRCAVIGKHPIVRIVTDEGLYGLGEVEFTKTYLKPWVLHFREALIGEDPTDVERVMLKIRQRGSFKPYGAAVSAIEHALWDIAGKAAGVPVYKLLGGKVRDKVRVYNGSIRRKRTGDRPEDYASDVKWMMERPENFFMIKQGISFHSNMKTNVPDFHYGVTPAADLSRRHGSGA